MDAPPVRRTFLLAALLAAVAVLPLGSAATLTAVNVSGASQSTGAVTTWTFAFSTVSAVPASGDIRIVFPAGFQTSSGAATTCDVTAPGTVAGETTTVVSATEIVCNLGAADGIGATTATSLTLTNIRNPTTAQTTAAFTVQTRSDLDAVIDDHLTNTETITASALTALSAAGAQQTTGSTSTWTIQFTTVNAIAANGDIQVTFPAGFQTSNGAATVCAVTAPGTAGAITTTVDSATRVTCSMAGTIAASTAVTVTLTNIRAPTTVQNTGTFAIETQDAADAVHDTGTAAGVAITASALTALSAAGAQQTTGSTSTWTIQFTTVNAIAANGDIQVTFPAGFQTSNGAATVCAVTAPGTAGVITTTVDSATRVTCSMAGTIAASTAVTVTLTNIRAPTTVQNTGTFAIETQDAADAVHDTGTAAGVAITASLLTAVSFAAPTQAADTVETWTVQFTTVNAVGASGDVRIVFPAGFQTSSGAATVCDVTAPGTVTAETTTVASATEVVCNLAAGDSIAAATAVTLTLTNIRNPVTAQDPTGAFTLQTRNNADAVHDAHTTNTEAIGAGAQASLGVGTIHWLDFGTANSVTDDCAYLDTQGAAAAVAPSNFDIRLLTCSGKAPGTLVGDGDAAEKNFPAGPLNTAPAVTLKYADVNGNSRYDPGDYLYLGTGAATVLQSSTSPAQFTIRLTAAASKAAGTLAVVGDADLTTYANGVQAWTGSLSWLDRDLSPNGEFTPGDDAYLIPRPAGAAQNVLFPSMSLRASAANTAGAFGTQVRLADADALPQVNLGTGPVAAPPAADLALAGADIVAAPATVRVAATGIYEDLANPGTVGAGDVRHVSYVPGLLPAVVAAGDSDIGVALSTPSADFPVIAFADAAADGAATSALTLGDNLYNAATPGAAVTAAHRRYAQLARVLHADLGVVGDYKDNCVYLDVDHSNTVSVLDLRLVPCQAKAAGTLVLDADTTERQAASTAPAMKLVWADVNGNGRLDEADPVYLTTTAGAATTLTPSSSAAAHTIRLTAAGGKAAGTFAAAGDTDLSSYSAVTVGLAAGLAFIDRDMSATLTSGDHAYLQVAGSVSLVHKILPLQSVRVNENPNGAYGSRVLVGHADLLETTGKASIPATPVHYLDFGLAGDYRDDCVYLEMQGTAGAAAVAPSNFDLRLTACQGKGFATPVLDGDAVEKNFPAGALNTAPAVALKYADTNGNARYDPADHLYLATGAATVLPATTGPAQFSIRLTSAAGKPAGSFVVVGDADLASYSAGVVSLAASVAWFDKDASAGGEHTEGDVVYVLPRTAPGYAAGNLLPLRRLQLTPPAAPAPTTSTSASPSSAPPTTTETSAGTVSQPPATSSGVPASAPPATDGAPGQTSPSTSPQTTTQGTPGPWLGAVVALALLGAWRMRRKD